MHSTYLILFHNICSAVAFMLQLAMKTESSAETSQFYFRLILLSQIFNFMRTFTFLNHPFAPLHLFHHCAHVTTDFWNQKRYWTRLKVVRNLQNFLLSQIFNFVRTFPFFRSPFYTTASIPRLRACYN